MRSFFKGSALAALALAAIVGQSSAAPTPELLVTRSYVKMEHRAQKAFLYDSCETDNDCLGRTCDVESKTCASTFLSNGSQCSSSIVCESGNCQWGKCAAKVQPGAYCEKDQNCGSGRCSKRLSRCLPAATTEAVVNSLQSTMPWGKDTEALQNLDPIPAVDLYYSDHGIHRSEASALIVNMSSNANYDAVVLTHTSLVGHISCPDSGHLSIPFTTSEAYEHVAKAWDRKHGFLLVTHTHGCGSSQSEDERTFWLASQLHFDDHTHTVSAKASELAIEHALDEISLDWGQKDPTFIPDFEHINPDPVVRSLEEVVALNQMNETDSWATPAHFVKRAGPSLPGSCGTTPAGVSCGPNFDKQLDAINGFLDFEGDFEGSLKALAPGLSSFALSDYVDAEQLADLNLDTPSRRAVGELHRRWSFKKIGQALSKVTKVVAKVVNTVAPKGSFLSKAVNFLAKTPLGKVVKLLVTGEWTESISGKIQLGWKYGGAKEDTPWGKQPVIWSAEGQKATSKNSGKDAQTSARLRKAKGSPRARARASGSVSLYCVDCQILGTFTYRGTISFKLLKASITTLSADFSGALDAGAQFGVVVQAELVATYRKTIITFPLPGGFAIKDVVTIGPAALVEASFKFVANAEADLLLGAKVKHRVNHHIDLLDSSKSKTTGSGLQFTASKDLQGAASASLQAGLPLSLTLGVSMKPIKLKRDLSVTAEPSVTASIMTATSEDAFEDSKLPACPLGLAWGINSGIAFSMNLLSLAKFKLGSFNANLGKGCIDFGLGGPVVSKYSDAATDYCPDGKCTLAVDDANNKATVSWLLPNGNPFDGVSSSFKSVCDGSMVVTMHGGMAGPSGFQGYRRAGAKIVRQISDVKKGDTYTVQVGGSGKSDYYQGDTRGGWPNGGAGDPNHDVSGGGGSTELITSSGERLMVAGGAGGNGRGNIDNYAGFFPEDNHHSDDVRGGPGSNGGGGGGGGLIGGAGGNDQGGYAGTSTDEPEGYPDWIDGRMIIDLTCN